MSPEDSARGESRPAVNYEAVWNTLPSVALAIGPDDRIADVNGAAESFFHLSARALRGRTIGELFGDSSRILDLVAQLRKGAVSLGEYDLEMTMPDRSPKIVDLHAAMMADRSGEVLLVIQPQSFAEKMDRSLSHRSAARTVSGMAAMLAHEIKNPLAGISGAAQLLEMNLGDSEHELTALIREEAERIAKLLERVDQFGDSRPIERQPVNIHDVLDRARLSAQAGFAGHVRMIEEYDPSLPPAAGDPDQLMQVFLNLLKNAAEATPQVGGLITIRTSYRPGMRLATPAGGIERLPLQVSISDNGSGVPAAIKRDIFEPFVTSKSTGTGLGLALVSKIITDHGGVVECESDPGWTTFRLLLPVWSEKKRKPRDVKKDAKKKVGSK